MSSRILIIDDEATIRSSLQEALTLDGYEVEVAEAGEAGLALCHGKKFDLLITDLRLPGVSGLEILSALRNQGNQIPVIMMTAYGDMDTALEAMRGGAYDFIPKPFKLTAIKKQVKAALRATAAEEDATPRVETAEPEVRTAASSSRSSSRSSSGGQYMEMIQKCEGLDKVARILEKIGNSRSGNDTSILIQGESGSGKEIVARAVHEVSQGNRDRFMEINCSALPETLLESELFGHEKGAFTDAKTRKEGLFTLAGEGTIFLDEIGEMGILLQSRLLRVLESRRFRRVGGKDDLEVRARVVAATNRNLHEAIENGIFRNDLYYRLQVVEIEVPSLRERAKDLRTLIEYFISSFNLEMGLETEKIDDGLLEQLQKYPWPGNVRELRNVLKRIMILEGPKKLEAQHFPSHILSGLNPRNGSNRSQMVAGGGLMPLAEVEKQQILYTLEQTENNKSKAARILGISRQTLREKLRLYETDEDQGIEELKADEARG
jgi:DNA-binding NtrC family response regulator|nr:sigma-54 dependent transcriptional regulator [Candidatus Krumholzibacteria bacterium]